MQSVQDSCSVSGAAISAPPRATLFRSALQIVPQNRVPDNLPTMPPGRENVMSRRRRDVLLGVTAAATAGALPAPAIAQGIKELKLATSWTPEKMTGLQSSAERLAQSITTMSDGRLKVTVYPAESLVHAFEVFDAVGAGVADMYHGTDYYFDKSPALNFFSAVP